jgi:S-adenosylmethionine-diacylgycerolhomoserine-N-methlytransferase
VSSATQDAARHMDVIYRHQRHIYNATRKYYLLGRDRLLNELQPDDGSIVLEIGCGTGRNLIHAARRWPHARFVGFDISRAMLETARVAIARARLSHRIDVYQADATTFDMLALCGEAQVRCVFISYALSMIPPWRRVLEQALAAVGPGGRLYVLDFGHQEAWHPWFKAMLLAWLRQFSVEPRADLEPALAKLASDAGAVLEFQRLYRGYADYAVITKPACSSCDETGRATTSGEMPTA